MEVTTEDKVELLMDAVTDLQVKAAVYDDPEVEACRRVYEALAGLPLDMVERVLCARVPKEKMQEFFAWLKSDLTPKEFRARQKAAEMNEADVLLT